MSKEEVFERLRQGISSYSSEEIKNAARDVIDNGIDPLEAISVLTKAIREVGEKFSRMEIFLAQLIKAARAMRAGMEVLVPEIPKGKEPKLKKIVIGTVKGDIHDIGKMIVSAMLEAGGFEIHDIGVDVPPSKFLKEAEKVNADIVAASALLTTTRPILKDLIECFKVQGIREKYKIMVGGGTVRKEYAEEIGADGYGEDAVEAVRVARRLVGEESP